MFWSPNLFSSLLHRQVLFGPGLATMVLDILENLGHGPWCFSGSAFLGALLGLRPFLRLLAPLRLFQQVASLCVVSSCGGRTYEEATSRGLVDHRAATRAPRSVASLLRDGSCHAERAAEVVRHAAVKATLPGWCVRVCCLGSLRQVL